MMKINLQLIIGTILAIVIIACSTVAFAADPVIIGNPAAENETANNQTVDQGTNNTTFNAINTTYNIQTNTNTTTTLPKTGVTDGYVVAILIAVCGISAIYAYRKIRDYNIK